MKSEHWQIKDLQEPVRHTKGSESSQEEQSGVSSSPWMIVRTGGSSVPLVVNHKLIGFADIELKVYVVGPCDGAFYQSPVLLCRNSF